jgi:uncharacterized protein (DUF4415 family)
MSKNSTSKTPNFIDPDDAPPVRQEDIDRSVFRVGLRPVGRGKVHVALDLDASVVQYFKNKAGRGSYQTLINDALGDYIVSDGIEGMLRRVIREEMGGTA